MAKWNALELSDLKLLSFWGWDAWVGSFSILLCLFFYEKRMNEKNYLEDLNKATREKWMS